MLAFAAYAGSVASPAAVAQGTVNVAVQDNYYNPQTITVAPGTTVRWTNQGTNLHTVTSDTGLFNSGVMAPGTSFSRTFNTSGTYAYHCSFHSATMRAVINVTSEGTSTPPQPGASPTPVPPSGNLALGKQVAASSSRAGHPPSYAVDGNLATFWASLPAGYGGTSDQPEGNDTGRTDVSPAPSDAAALEESWSQTPLSEPPGGAPNAMARPESQPGAAPPSAGITNGEPDPESAQSGVESNPLDLNEPQRTNYEWFQIDLGAEYSVNRLQMQWTASDYALGYSIYVYQPSCGGWCHLGSTTRGDGNDTLLLSSPTRGRYFLLWLVYPARPYGPYELREWTIQGAEPPGPTGNLALNRPAVASSSLAGHPPANAFDGTPATDWRSAGFPAWIYVDLGVHATVRQAVLDWTPGMHATSYGIYAWTGYGWTGLYGTYSGDGGRDVVGLSARTTRYVALYAASGPGSGVGLQEFAVYAAATQPLPFSGDDALSPAAGQGDLNITPANGSTGAQGALGYAAPVERARFDWRLAPESLRMPAP